MNFCLDGSVTHLVWLAREFYSEASCESRWEKKQRVAVRYKPWLIQEFNLRGALSC